MLNADLEIQRFRQDLLYNEIPKWKVDKICDQTASEISQQVTVLISNAMERAAINGIDIGANDFVNQLTVLQSGNCMRIGTTSGKTDFTEPPFPMLPKLLKNAKTAKDGSRYKVIPVGGGSQTKPKLNVFEAINNINSARAQALQQNESGLDQNSSKKVMNGPIRFSQTVDLRSLQKKTQTKDTIKDPEFKTVSSKQNPQEKWVQPEKKLDMTSLLNNINDELERDIDDTIRDTIDSKKREYLCRM